MDDWELLQEYVAHDSSAAFEALVGRYMPLVYGCAFRAVRDHHAAEDITQAVFAMLARRARHLRHGTVIAGWLFRATQYAAANLRKIERRRQYHEREAGQKSRMEIRGLEYREESLTELDAAIARLRSRDRDAVLLRYYRQLPLAKVGAVMGISEAAAKKRITRAVGRLRQLMVGSGTAIGAPVVTTALGNLGNVITGTAEALTASALATAKGAGGAGYVSQIMKGALNMMFWAKMKTAALIVVAVATVGGGTVMVPQMIVAQSPPAAQPPAAHVPVAPIPEVKLEELQRMANDARAQAEDAHAQFKLPPLREQLLADLARVNRLRDRADELEFKAHIADRGANPDGIKSAQIEAASAREFYLVARKEFDDVAIKYAVYDRKYAVYDRMDRLARAFEDALVKARIHSTLNSLK